MIILSDPSDSLWPKRNLACSWKFSGSVSHFFPQQRHSGGVVGSHLHLEPCSTAQIWIHYPNSDVMCTYILFFWISDIVSDVLLGSVFRVSVYSKRLFIVSKPFFMSVETVSTLTIQDNPSIPNITSTTWLPFRRFSIASSSALLAYTE